MAGFFPLGVLLGMLGSLVVTWQYHMDASSAMIGVHFLALSAGFVFAARLIPLLFSRLSVRTIVVVSTVLSIAALAALTVLAPPAAPGWRVAALFWAGVAAGGLAPSLFHANESRFASAPASATNRAGALFVGGALLATIVAGVSYFGVSIRQQTALLALVPFVYLLSLHKLPPHGQPAYNRAEETGGDVLRDLRSIATWLFSLLIFFQFACEWAIAGWLPLFLIRTLGMNPVTAIGALGLYFLALMLGRLLSQALLPIVSHRKMLLISVALAMGGYLLLSITTFTLPALIAAAVIGIGHAPIYPLVAERLDHRLSYRPGLYSGTLSLAISGATATPWLLGYVAETHGMPAVMWIPAIASIVVLLLAVLIMLESHLMGRKRDDSPHILLASDR